MTRLHHFIAIVLLIWASPFVWAERCESLLQPVSLIQIAYDMHATQEQTVEIVMPGSDGRSAGDYVFHAFDDEQSPELLLFAPFSESSVYPHEALTARDYARFVEEEKNLRFVLMAHFEGHDVPVFDGLLLKPDGQPVSNVSLKYTTLTAEQPNLENLTRSLSSRLRNAQAKESLVRTPMAWFSAFNGLPTVGTDWVKFKHYDRLLLRTQRMAALFDLFRPGSQTFGRDLHLVVDMRDSGFSYEFTRQRKSLDSIAQVLREYVGQGVSLTLIWDSHHVIEFKEDWRKFYQPD